MTYPKPAYVIGEDASVLRCDRAFDKTVNVRPDLPCNIIVIHGVNDVGTSFSAVEAGLCQGLDARLHGIEPGKAGMFVPGTYRMPTAKDKDIIEPDPDAVFFKRQESDKTFSPVIPFYWGFRETFNKADTCNGQRIDRHGNRLDKDLSKNGGPFGNATNSLPDMWNKGLFSPLDVGGDPVRPLMTAPGRMYMILAAKRLAALIAMIRDYDKDEVVSIVAHSQGCLISLLAQAFLLDEGNRPADTLILTHPPYSLVEDTTLFFGAVEKSRVFGGGEDAAMDGQYTCLNGRQTLHARLQTLINIVQGVVKKKHAAPAFAAMKDQGTCRGMVGAKWTATADRDNRGKVYLYFCPEDMTVALDNIQGIGWQGVPDHMTGTALSEPLYQSKSRTRSTSPELSIPLLRGRQDRKPLSEIGAGFFQRVFTSKKRLDPVSNKVTDVLVGQAPHDFALRIKDEDDHAHVAGPNRSHRASFARADGWHLPTTAGKRIGLRSINGEALRVPVAADLRGSGQIDPKHLPRHSTQTTLPANMQGPCEDVDQIDAAIAVTSKGGLIWRPEELIADPYPASRGAPGFGSGELGKTELEAVQLAMNRGKDAGDQSELVRARCAYGKDQGKLVILRFETPNEARKRWQNEVSPKSFHGAIIGNSENHRNVTAYDVAIGGGKASSDPKFYKYLCAVADWRLKKLEKGERLRPSIRSWTKFREKYEDYWDVEPPERRNIIEGNAEYYSSGNLPACVPALYTGLPSSVICETLNGQRTTSARPVPPVKQTAPATDATGRAKKDGA